MKWLVTIEPQADRETITELLRSLNCEVLPSDRPVTLGADGEVLSVEGPANLVQLAKRHAGKIKVYPNSKMKAF